jgi:TonB-linked SusC/RagA family outer membrane protein
MRKIYNVVFYILISIMMASYASAQTPVSGIVKDESGMPIAGVNVVVKGTTNGTSTDGDGRFTILVQPDENPSLFFSFIGYKKQEVQLGQRTSLEIFMEPDISTLNEIVVVGYGTQERQNVTGAVATIKSDALKDLPLTSIDQKLSGQVAGVQVSQVTGTPGGGIVVRVRGSGSIGAGDDPLYVIDGFPVTNNYNRSANPLSTLNPDDIESITVLKDASSTAIYGSRGSNGVILITTKKAKTGIPVVEWSAYVGAETIPNQRRIKMMSAQEFAEFRVQHRQDLAAFQNVAFNPATIPAEYQDPASLGNGTDWFDELTQTALIQNYNLTISKGGESMRTLISAGYFDQEGTVRNTGFKRYSMRANIEATPHKAVVVGFNLNPSYVDRKLAGTEGHFDESLLTQSLLNSPLPTVRQPDGTYTSPIVSPDAFSNANPVSMLMETTNISNSIRMLTNSYVDIEPLKGLHFKSTFNIDWSYGKSDYFKPSTVGLFRAPPPQPATGNLTYSSMLNWLNENTLTYDKIFGVHTLNILAGYTVQEEKFEENRNNGSQYANDVVQTINGATAVTPVTSIQQWRLLSYLGRINYSFQGKYLVSAAIRRDGSSRFGQNNRWGVFPSISAGWQISEESFFPDTEVISEMKLRASYGLSGNNSIGNYTYIPGIGTDNYTFNGALANGFALNSLANTELGWESSRQLDIGLDASFLNGRIYFIGEYYRRHTENMLQNIVVPFSSGFTNATTNLGKVRNHGIELTLNTKNTTRALVWETDFNISFNRNKVLDLGGNSQIISGAVNTNISKVGSPMGMFYGYIFEGIFQTQEELDASPKQAGQVVGSVKYTDTSGDGIIDVRDRAPMGSPYPDFIYGITNKFKYKNFDLSILINGSQGAKVLDLYKRFTTNIDGVFNVEQEVKNRWRSAEYPGDGKIPTSVANTALSREVNSLWVKDASFMAVRNITLGYRIKTKFINNIRLYASAQNALLFTPYKGGWPEINFNGNNSLAPGVNYTGYPVPRTFIVGANFKL